jgi:hypothetical protein
VSRSPTERTVLVTEKDRLAAVATLGDMVRKAGNDDGGEAGHRRMIDPKWR